MWKIYQLRSGDYVTVPPGLPWVPEGRLVMVIHHKKDFERLEREYEEYSRLRNGGLLCSSST